MGSELYHHLKALIKKKYGLDATAVGDEGGFAPNFQNNGEALELLVEAIKKAGYEGKIFIGMDIAASELVKDYPVITIEDPFDQDDWEGYGKLTAQTNIQIVGDDLLVTNPTRISTAIQKRACNGLLLKVNQIGTVTESIKA